MGKVTKVDWDNPASYKNCSKKSYDIYVCMPPKNTVVINKLEQADAVRQLGGKTYFTVNEIDKLSKSNQQMFSILLQLVSQGKAYAVTDAMPFVLCGTVGEMWTIDANKLAQTYTFLQNNQPYQITNQSLNQRVRKDGLLDWTSIRVSPRATQGQNMACFVPVAQKGQIQTSWGAVLNINGAGVSHGKGDFVVCAKLPNGKPNLADRWVVNGEIFATTYNNQGWADCLKQSGIKNITIGDLPKLVPQQTVSNDKGVDPNVFKKKCDTIMKELQKIYKFEVKSNTYEILKDYEGLAYEVDNKGDSYVAKYVVGGNFSHTRSVKSQTSEDMVKKTATATETDVWFSCSAIHSNSAIAMAIRPHTNLGNALTSSWAFPHNSNAKPYTEWTCKVGTINDINCAEEVKFFKEKCKGRDAFIDNRKNARDSFDVSSLIAGMKYNHVSGAIGVDHVLEEVYGKLTSDTLKERVSLCLNEYNNLDIGHGSASLGFASRKEKEVKGSMVEGSLSHKMNLKSLIEYLVSACQQEETYYDALLVLYRFSSNALTEAIMKLFYDSKNPNIDILWKRLDLQYMCKNEIDLYIYERSEHDVNKDRVCIDFHLNDFDDGVFVRCFYTAAGNYGFDFIPKTPLHEYKVGATFSFNRDYDNYFGVCKQLRDSCYMCLTDWTNSSRTFIEHLPEYLIKTDFEYLDKLGYTLSFYFRVISAKLNAHNAHNAQNTEYNKETNTYRIKFAVKNNETRTIYMSEDDAHTISVKCSLDGVTFEKNYKLSIKRNININGMLIFSDICKALKIHPAKELLKSKRLWNRVAQNVSEKFSDGHYRKFDSVGIIPKINKIVPVSIKLNDTNYEILMRFYNNEEVIGERILVVDFNYDNFDIRNSRSRSIKALRDLRFDTDIMNMMFVMHYKYDSTSNKGTEHDTSFDEHDIEMALYWTTWELINTTKKYQA